MALSVDVELDLRKALQATPTLEARRRIEKLLTDLKGQPLPASLLREQRAVAVLELIATPEAHRILTALAKARPNASRTQQARAALARLDLARKHQQP